MVEIARTIDEVDDPIARDKFKELIKEPHVKGIMLWGSRATGFGENETDWDAVIYVTDEFFDTLSVDDLEIIIVDESAEPKRLSCDFTYLSDRIFKQQLNSPMDIDHSAYVEGVVIHDPTGKLEEWRKKLAAFPEGEERVHRIKIKWIQVVLAFYTAKLNDKRGFTVDCQLNLQRTIQAAVNFWFSLKGNWTPPLKWWTKHVRKLKMTDEMFTAFTDAIINSTMENVEQVVKMLKKAADEENVDLSNFNRDFFETLLPEGRARFIRHGYL
ncbi:MAG: DUF4037 domain-containing protein [Candidatus Hodarchaeales archaeon]